MDAIAEFVLVTNRFDATQGRSAGMMANAVTKSGTNNFSGTLSGFFRSDRFNAPDFIQNRVLPYSNQQVSGTLGGPIVRDRAHFFVNYEIEREPRTITFSSAFPAFNIDQLAENRQNKGVARFDAQFSPQTHFYARVQRYYFDQPFGGTGGATSHPSTARRERRYSDQFFSTFTQVIGSRAVNEIKGGFALYDYTRDSHVKWMGDCFPNAPVDCGGSVTISFRGYSIGSAVGQHQYQNNYSIRDDFTISFVKGGRHDVKIGGEYINQPTIIDWCAQCTGAIEANGGPIPANIQELFPVWNDASTWNLAALSPITVRVRQAVSNTDFHYEVPQHLFAGWLQDDWRRVEQADAQPGRALRRPDRRPLRESGAAPVADRRPAARLEQRRPAPRVRLQRQRPHRRARRLRALLHAGVDRRGAPDGALYRQRGGRATE